MRSSLFSCGMVLLAKVVLVMSCNEHTEVTQNGVLWHISGNHRYYIHNGTNVVNYNDAVKRCQELHSHLAQPDNDKKHKEVIEFIKLTVGKSSAPPYVSFYIGLLDYTGNNANFIWVNGDQLDFTTYGVMQWAHGEPNNFNRMDEDCVTMGSRTKIAEYAWFDVPCDMAFSYICEKQLNNLSFQFPVLTTAMVFFVLAVVFLLAFYQRNSIHKKTAEIEPNLPSVPREALLRMDVENRLLRGVYKARAGNFNDEQEMEEYKIIITVAANSDGNESQPSTSQDINTKFLGLPELGRYSSSEEKTDEEADSTGLDE